MGKDGIVTYKNISSDQIMGSVQLGIDHVMKSIDSYSDRDLVTSDFEDDETIVLPRNDADSIKHYHFPEFTFKAYAPFVFYCFRKLYGIEPDDYQKSFCFLPLRELSNPGASGSIFYTTHDDKYIMKTVQKEESKFLQKLLYGYYLNLSQNPSTLLPKFFGYYIYECKSKNFGKKLFSWKNKKKKKIKLIVMNNLLPSDIEIHEKYDLKGSTYNRKASESEKIKKKPTFKDLDFKEKHPHGIFLEPDVYTKLIETLSNDCRVLKSFEIMDYSLLMGVYYLNRGESLHKKTTNKPNVQRLYNNVDEKKYDLPMRGIPAWRVNNEKKEKILLFVGIIDILQRYNWEKKLEHTYKAYVHDGDTVSVHNPDFYATRFLNFMSEYVMY